MRCGFTSRSVAEESRSADEFFVQGRTEGDAGLSLASSINNDIFCRRGHWYSLTVKGRLGKYLWNRGERAALFLFPPHPHQLSCRGNALQHHDISCFPTDGLWRYVRLPALANRYRHNFWVSFRRSDWLNPNIRCLTSWSLNAAPVTSAQLPRTCLTLTRTFTNFFLQTKVCKVRSPFWFIDMPPRTGWHNSAAMGKSLPERGLLLLLMVWLFLEGSVLPLGAASSPDVTQQADLDNHKMSEQRSNETEKPFPVLSLDYENVRIPFEIALWVLLASLMKLGEYWSNVCASCERSSPWKF